MEPTLANLEEALAALERGAPGAAERLDALARQAGFADYAALQKWLSDEFTRLIDAIKSHFGEDEIELIVHRSKTDPVFRSLLLEAKNVPLKNLVRRLRREIYLEHYNPPVVVPPTPQPAQDNPKVPKRAADLQRWKQVWAAIRYDVENRRSTASEILQDAKKYRTALPHDRETLAAIIKAGRAGLLK
jgi:hypothetical protein